MVKGDFGQCMWNVLTLRDDSVSLENFEHEKMFISQVEYEFTAISR